MSTIKIPKLRVTYIDMDRILDNSAAKYSYAKFKTSNTQFNGLKGAQRSRHIDYSYSSSYYEDARG